MIADIIAFTATLFMDISYIPQIIRGYKRKSLADVSMSFLLLIAFAIVLWIFYAFQNNDFTFLIANSITLIFATSLVFMKFYYDLK